MLHVLSVLIYIHYPSRRPPRIFPRKAQQEKRLLFWRKYILKIYISCAVITRMILPRFVDVYDALYTDYNAAAAV